MAYEGYPLRAVILSLGELVPSGDWYKDLRDRNWLKVRADEVGKSFGAHICSIFKAECCFKMMMEWSFSSVVFGSHTDVFLLETGGRRRPYTLIWMNKEQKLKANKCPKSFRNGAESAQLETVAEVPKPAGMVSDEGAIFATDCEPALEFSSPGQALGGELDVD